MGLSAGTLVDFERPTPRVIRRSASFARLRACGEPTEPRIPTTPGSSSGMIPLARKVVRIGAPTAFARASTSADDSYAPQPARITGFFAARIVSAAAFREASDGMISRLPMQDSRRQ